MDMRGTAIEEIVAMASFFLGQPGVFRGGLLEPVALRVIPVGLVVAATISWRAQVSSRRLAVGDAA
jgi:hypothetical protein